MLELESEMPSLGGKAWKWKEKMSLVTRLCSQGRRVKFEMFQASSPLDFVVAEKAYKLAYWETVGNNPVKKDLFSSLTSKVVYCKQVGHAKSIMQLLTCCEVRLVRTARTAQVVSLGLGKSGFLVYLLVTWQQDALSVQLSSATQPPKISWQQMDNILYHTRSPKARVEL